jgi:hypothetical protein
MRGLFNASFPYNQFLILFKKAIQYILYTNFLAKKILIFVLSTPKIGVITPIVFIVLPPGLDFFFFARKQQVATIRLSLAKATLLNILAKFNIVKEEVIFVGMAGIFSWHM